LAASDGVYTGTTSQGRAISFTVSGGVITERSISWSCGGTSATTTYYGDCAIAGDGSFTCGSFSCSTAPYGLNTEISGTFSGASVSGSFDLAYQPNLISGPCCYQYGVTFSAGEGGGGGGGGGTSDCGNAYYDNGTWAGTAYFGGNGAGNPDNMYAVKFELADFGFTPGNTQITGFCAGNQRAWDGGPWPNEVFIYPDSGGLPDDGVVLGQGTIRTGDGELGNWYEVTLSSPVTLNGDFWLVSRGDPMWAGEDFNMDYDSAGTSDHSFGSDSGIAGLGRSTIGNYMLRATLQRGEDGDSCVQDLENGVVCLRNGRFEFVGTWTDFSNPPVTQPLIWTPVEDINATAGFQNNPSGIQVVMRVADGCPLTGTWWVWLGGFTDAGWNITVRDTVTGDTRTFTRNRQSGSFPTTTRDQTTFRCN
jgi:hypothetical protein